MSLFEDGRYEWRETYFVLFKVTDQPTGEQVAEALSQCGRFQLEEIRCDEQGRFESLSLHSPDDFSAMDVTFVTGEEVVEQVDELLRSLAKATLSDEERGMLDRMGDCDGRYDVFHFEKVAGDEEDIMDPGGLLVVLAELARLSKGIGVDPQSGSLVV